MMTVVVFKDDVLRLIVGMLRNLEEVLKKRSLL